MNENQLTPDAVEDLLQRGELDSLVGRFEDRRIEFKGQPYILKSDEAKLELAKDVSALANSAGGVIVIGIRTKRDEVHSTDVACELRPFEANLVDVQQYRDVLDDWIYPPIKGVRIGWHESASDAGRGVVAIVVPAADGPESPALVTKSVVDQGRRTAGHLFGYFERQEDRVVELGVERLHGLLQDGRRVDEQIRDGFESLHALWESMQSVAQAPRMLEDRLTAVQDGVDLAINAVGLAAAPSFSLWAMPDPAPSIGGLFESRLSQVVQLLDSPKELRPSGFDLDFGGNSRMVEGRLRRAMTSEYGLLEVWRDGSVIMVKRGDRSGLGWPGKHSGTQLLVNQLVLVETTLLFTMFLEQLYELSKSSVEEVHLGIRLRDMEREGQHCLLEAGPLTDFRPFDCKEAPDGAVDRKAIWPVGQDSAAQAAFRLVSELYAWFGYEADRVPYTEDEGGRRFISTEKIKAVR